MSSNLSRSSLAEWFSNCMMYFEEYSTTPNLTGKSLSYNDMIISMDCKVPSNKTRNERFLFETLSYKE